MRTTLHRSVLSLGIALAGGPLLMTPSTVHAQGCVAAHSPQPIVAGLSPNDQQRATDRIHGLTVTVGYRVYNSYRHYIGTVYQEQRAIAHNAVVNHVNLFNIDMSYQLTPRWSLIADVPTISASRAQQSDPLHNVSARAASATSPSVHRLGSGDRQPRATAI